MSNQRARCIFCFVDSGDQIARSREHLISQPVARAFGIDRDAAYVRLDWADPLEQKYRSLSGIALRRVCTTCNNQWMNRLEHAMTEIADWFTGPDEELGPARELTLRRWAIKTHLLLCFLEGEAADFGSNQENTRAVVPPMTLARELYEGDEDAIHAAPVGVARCTSGTDFAMAFGHPTMRWKGPKQWNPRFAPASVVTIGDLQLWVVTPHLSADVFTPPDVAPVSQHLRQADLRDRSHPTTVEQVVVDYGQDHDAEALIAELTAWAAAQGDDGGGSRD